MLPARCQALARCLIAVMALCIALGLKAQTVALTPNQHKALFLFNFAKYTEWPKEAFASDDAPFVLGILGGDPFGRDIDIIKGKPIKGRTLAVKHFKSVEEIGKTDCQLLFIGGDTNSLAQVLKAVEKTSILTIAETDGFLQASGMINLLTERKNATTQTVSFEVNLIAATKANLKLDVQLLKLAKSVLRT